MFRCADCKRSFREPGFCPYDGVALAAVADDRITVSSAERPAQGSSPPESGPSAETVGPGAGRPTEVQPLRTLPITPSTRSKPPSVAPMPYEAVSAAENTDAAIRALRQRTEYDRLVGETLDGRYFVLRKIGEGGMGVVFAVRHAVIERPLAVKVLKREVMRDDATIRRFVQEARAASRIGHPNIVDVTDFGKTAEGLTFTVMEMIEGQTLAQAIRHGAPFPLTRALRIAAQIARALGVAHDKGIVHRDLKPENVFLVDRDGRPDFVKIVDFGIAKVAPLPNEQPNQPRLTKVGSVFGTPEYMAPEQAAGRGDTDGRVDVYALGVILYEMLTGLVPHRGDSMVRTLAMQMLDPIMPPRQARPDAHISAEAEAVVMTALAKKRDQRYQTMGELLAALEMLAKQLLPAPSGSSVTGSPVYHLAPLPPGADVNATPAPGMAPPMSQGAAGAGAAGGPVAEWTPTQRRIKNEPQFVTSDRASMYLPSAADEAAGDRPRSRTGLVLLSLVALASVTTAAVVMITKRGASSPGGGSGGTGSDGLSAAPVADAAVIAVRTMPDAAVIESAPPPVQVDAGLDVVPVDAATAFHPPRGDAGVHAHPPHTDAGGPIRTPEGTAPARIVVMTKPDGAALYVGTSYRGPGGTTLEEPTGTRETVECRATGYKPGRVQLVFDGQMEATMCVLTRIKICIDNIKNPFDDCEVDPARPSPDHAH